MSSYDDPSTGHKTAVRQLQEARDRFRDYLRVLNAMPQRGWSSSSAPHPNLVPEAEAPTARTEAQAALADYILQLRPYRTQTQRWGEHVATVRLPKEITGPKPGGGSRPFTLQHPDPTISIDTLGDVSELSGLRATYTAPKVGNNNYGTDVDGYLVALSPKQMQVVYSIADDVATEGDFLAETGEMDRTDKAGL